MFTSFRRTVRDDYSVKLRRCHIRQSNRKRMIAEFINEKAVRVILNPSLCTPNLLCTVFYGGAIPTAPIHF